MAARIQFRLQGSLNSNDYKDLNNAQKNQSLKAASKSDAVNDPAIINSGVQQNNSLNAGTSMLKSSNSNSHKQSSNRSSKSSIPRNPNFVTYKPLNLSSSLLSVKLFNRNLLQNPARFSSQERIQLTFTIKPISTTLESQSITWASKIDSSPEIDKYKIFGRERFDGEYLLKLQKIYVYSYYKCLLLGINEYNIDQTSDSDHCLVGHSLLYHMLYKRRITIETNGIFVSYVFDISQSEIDFIVSEANKYDFISNSIASYGNRFNIVNTTIERHIEYLRSAIDLAGCDVLFVRLSDKVKIPEYMTEPCLPLANSFWSLDQSKWYFAYNEKSHLNGITSLFGKANFITLKKMEPSNVTDFEQVITSSDQNILLKYEVSTISSSKYFDCRLEGNKLCPKIS